MTRAAKTRRLKRDLAAQFDALISAINEADILQFENEVLELKKVAYRIISKLSQLKGIAA